MVFGSTRPGGELDPNGVSSNDVYVATRERLRTPTPTVADFDGDGRSDVGVFRPSDSTWYVIESGTNTFQTLRFGVTGDKIVPGDYDGDGRTDQAVFRDGVWYILQSSNGSASYQFFGLSTDIPVSVSNF